MDTEDMWFKQDGALCIQHLNKPESLDDLKVNVVDIIQDIQPNLCNLVIENWTSRVRALQSSRGGHLNVSIFHT